MHGKSIVRSFKSARLGVSRGVLPQGDYQRTIQSIGRNPHRGPPHQVCTTWPTTVPDIWSPQEIRPLMALGTDVGLVCPEDQVIMGTLPDALVCHEMGKTLKPRGQTHTHTIHLVSKELLAQW